ncbi:MAG: DNA-processing protein DprA [Lachnospiraceae bacterium]|nr:DNA-processing protein DprA [Lachnospiraceae bacterium]
MEEKIYDYWFYSLEGLRYEQRETLLARLQSTKEIYESPMERIIEAIAPNPWVTERIYNSRNTFKLKQEYENMQKMGVRFICCKDIEYPEKLRNMKEMPGGLFVKGELPLGKEKTVAVIGARECSCYGKFVAQEIGKALAEQGVELISGMARGVDGYAQMAAIEAGGKSFGVLGCGVDICYPRENYNLYRKLPENGGILSEYRIGVPAIGRNFPRRNRIISGLADVIIVVEAKKRSGTSITVSYALEQGKDVMAVPGRITDCLSEGCNYLISQGAYPVNSLEEMMEDLGFPRKKNIKKRKNVKNPLESDANLVYAVLDFVPKTITAIGKELGENDMEKINRLLFDLEIEDKIEQVTTGYYVRKQ